MIFLWLLADWSKWNVVLSADNNRGSWYEFFTSKCDWFNVFFYWNLSTWFFMNWNISYIFNNDWRWIFCRFVFLASNFNCNILFRNLGINFLSVRLNWNVRLIIYLNWLDRLVFDWNIVFTFNSNDWLVLIYSNFLYWDLLSL